MFNRILIILLLSGCAAAQSVPQTNAGTTGTTANLLATVNASGQAVTVTTSQTSVPIWIVTGNPGTAGSGLLATTGQANCIFDATNASFGSSPVYVVASTITTGDCHAQTATPSAGTCIAGYLSSAATTIAQTATVNVQPSCFGAGSVAGPGSSTSGDLSSFNGTGGNTLQDTGIASSNVVTSSVTLTSNIVAVGAGAKAINVNSAIDYHNLVTAASAATAANQVCVASGATKSCTYIDFPDYHYYIMASCIATAASTVDAYFTPTSKAACFTAPVNDKGGYIGGITSTSTTWFQFETGLPQDWDTTTGPFLRFAVFSGDATSGHTLIPQIEVECIKGDGTTTYDTAFNAAHSASTVTLNGTANEVWNTSTVQLNSTDLTGCVAGSLMNIFVGRATDTATGNLNVIGIGVTIPRLLTVQAN